MEIYTIQHPDILPVIERDGYYRPSPELCMDNTDDYFVYRLCYRWMTDMLYEKCGLPLGMTQSQYDLRACVDDEAMQAGWKMIYPNPDSDEFPRLAMCVPSYMPHPVWGFQKVFNKPHARPDMRSWTTDEPEKVIRLRLEMPTDRLLFSDLDYWHIPLNKGYFPTAADSDEWEREDALFDERCRALRRGLVNAGDLFSEKIDHIYTFDEDAGIAKLQREFLDSWRNCLVGEEELGSVDDPQGFREQTEWIKRETQCVFWEIRQEDIKGIEQFTTRGTCAR